MSDHWAIMPFVNNVGMTTQAVNDLLAQSLRTRVLLVNQGADQETADRMREFVEQHHPQVLMWSYLPGLPSLSAVWNRALRFVWELGGEEALVVNNDVRLHRRTYELLSDTLTHRGEPLLFISAVGVREGQFDPDYAYGGSSPDILNQRGGPDFSCFLIAKAGHDRYSFDESFIPAYHEDLDMHRRYMLGGDGDKIFSVNLPYLHYASGTLKQYTPEERSRFNKGFAACKQYYMRKWGGPPNEETFYTPFGKLKDHESYNPELPITTPDLQAWWQKEGAHADVS
jgi:hypothetical protein